MKLKPKLLVLTSVFGLIMAFASAGYAQSFDGGPEPAAMMDAGPVAADVEAAPVPAPAMALEVETSVLAPSEPAAAPATTESQTALAKLSAEIFDMLFPVFKMLLLGLATLLLIWVRKKYKLDVSDRIIKQWSSIADKAADRGGEWVRNKTKSFTDGRKIPGPEILEVAVDWAITAGRAYGLPAMGREKLIGLIESRLHAKRTDPSHPLPLEYYEEPAED